MATTEVSERRVGSTLYVRDRLRLNEKQRRAVTLANHPDVDEFLFHGSVRGGKTQVCGRILSAWAWKYGGQYLVTRATTLELENTTKRAMLVGDGRLPPAIPPAIIKQDYAYGGQNKVVLKNGAEILFRSLEPNERGKIRNLTLAGCFIDQVEEFDSENDLHVYEELMGRLSDPEGPCKMLLAANPGPEDHWVARRFGVPEQNERWRHPRTAEVHCTIYDNKENLRDDYVKRLIGTKDSAPDYYARMVMGEWGAFGGKRFKAWDPKLSVVPKVRNIPADWEILEGCDYGWDHPTAWIWGGLDPEGRLWITAEHRESQRSVAWHAAQIKAIRKGGEGTQRSFFGGSLEPSVSWLDPANFGGRREHATIAQEFHDHGIHCAKAQNDRISGWARIEDLLAEMSDDGYSRLRFFPTCEMIQEEIRGAKIKTGTDDIEKTKDDLLDGLRYIVNARMRPRSVEEEEEANPHSRRSVAGRILTKARAGPTAIYTGES